MPGFFLRASTPGRSLFLWLLMSSQYISKTKCDQLADFMSKMGISDDTLIEKFILGSGKGGQKVNKTSSCVYLKDTESGIEVKCQRSRSREINRYYARKELCEKIEEIKLGVKSRRQQQIEKERRRKRRRSRRQKENMLKKKHIQSEKKKLRASVSVDEGK